MSAPLEIKTAALGLNISTAELIAQIEAGKIRVEFYDGVFCVPIIEIERIIKEKNS